MQCVLILILSLFFNFSVFAEAPLKSNLTTNEITGEAQLLSHFIERGLSISDGNPALNASFLYKIGEQVRMGFWGSNTSNISASDDNFWFKLLAEFNLDFTDSLKSKFYMSDNHFYKSDIRNGLRVGINFDYYSYYFGFEWMSNLEGSRQNAEYFYLGKYFYHGNKLRYGGALGYTNSHTTVVNSYFDFKILAQYLLNTDTTFEVAYTGNSNVSGFGKRANAAAYAGIKLSY